MTTLTPNLDEVQVRPIDADALDLGSPSSHPPRILLLYGSLRERSFSRLAVEEAARLLQRFGAETRVYNPTGMPLPDGAEALSARVNQRSI